MSLAVIVLFPGVSSISSGSAEMATSRPLTGVYTYLPRFARSPRGPNAQGNASLFVLEAGQGVREAAGGTGAWEVPEKVLGGAGLRVDVVAAISLRGLNRPVLKPSGAQGAVAGGDGAFGGPGEAVSSPLGAFRAGVAVPPRVEVCSELVAQSR